MTDGLNTAVGGISGEKRVPVSRPRAVVEALPTPAVKVLRGADAEAAVQAGRARTAVGIEAPGEPRRLPTALPGRAGAPDVEPEVALAKIERLGGEVPGMLRSLDDAAAEAVRLDHLEFDRVRQLKATKQGYPSEAVDDLGKRLEALRTEVGGSMKQVAAAWNSLYAPWTGHPRALHERARAVTPVAKVVEDLDKAYEAAASDKDGWTGADADAYRRRVEPQRKAASEYHRALLQYRAGLVQAALLHAGVYVVAHQMIQRAVNEIVARNARRSEEGAYAMRMSVAAKTLGDLGDWLEQYARSGSWHRQVTALGARLGTLGSDAPTFVGERWPSATTDPSALRRGTTPTTTTAATHLAGEQAARTAGSLPGTPGDLAPRPRIDLPRDPTRHQS